MEYYDQLFKWWMVSFLLIFYSIGLGVRGQPEMPCYFIFGDSLADNGNNNALVTLAKANHPPYGVDFPLKATGRFTNGRTVVDIIAQLLGFINFIPPFATTHGPAILQGVNYASGSSGIRNETGQNNGAKISLDEQLRNHQTTISGIARTLGTNDLATQHLKRCLYSIGMGSNDYLNNYFLPNFYPTSRRYTPDQYAEVLIQQYSQQIMTLYNYGARKVALFGLGPLGCIPAEIAIFGTNGTCVDTINSATQLFNTRLKSLVDELNNKLTDAQFLYNDYYSIFLEATASPASFGFKVTNAPCCQIAINNGLITCLILSTPCPNRNEYVFWDGAHPTEAANVIVAQRAYNAKKPSVAYPFGIQQLVQL